DVCSAGVLLMWAGVSFGWLSVRGGVSLDALMQATDLSLLNRYGAHRGLHSSPARRSSDLGGGAAGGGATGGGGASGGAYVIKAEIGRAHVCTPVTWKFGMSSPASDNTVSSLILPGQRLTVPGGGGGGGGGGGAAGGGATGG